MTPLQTKHAIQQALHTFTNGSLKNDALTLFDTLGYKSDKQLELESNTAAGFLDTFNLRNKLNPERALLDEWQAVEFLFQLTQDEISQSPQLDMFTTDQVDNSIIESYLFLALDLRGDHYPRTQLARITREVNKQFPMPVLLLFRYGPSLTLSVINRRLHQRDPGQDVLEKVTLIKDINYTRPHRAHLEILHDLSLDQLYQAHGFTNFVELHRAWQTTLDSSELNKRFFKEVANWYFWAVDNVTFPPDAHPDPKVRTATSVIRLITRLIFVWFIKEKGLVPDDLFDRRKLAELLTDADPNHSTYYKAILQNLFFATLNQEMNTPDKPDNRKFRHRAKQKGRRDQHYLIHNVYRYERYFKDPARAMDLFASIPFLNGGLFECLDHKDPDTDEVLRIDGFSDRPDNPLTVPDFLFFSDEHEVDLNEVYGTTGKRYKVRGLLNILSSYKFTIAENTPIEEEIALDPELLGQVFENLLAAYNPETETTARKQTGSFYTPREIVNYMVDESLMAYLETALRPPSNSPHRGEDSVSSPPVEDSVSSPPVEDSVSSPLVGGTEGGRASLQARLRHLLAYNEEAPQFSEAEKTRLIEAIDNLKILDPACGSGAFPMGILHKLVFILGKLDLHNERWKEKQIDKAVQIPDSTIREKVIEDIEEAFERNELDYGRKLYLVENCIYGVDIQPIAVQIAKLRFFISLVVDQTIDDHWPNRGVLPLPNLETKFVAANTLLGIDRPPQLALKDPAIARKEKELEEIRHRYFTARTPATKEKRRQEDAQIRTEIAALLKQNGFRPATTEKLAAWNPYDQNASADFFDPEWMFGIAEGFDIVIGNPPYVRQEKIKELKPALQAIYDCYTGIADLYVYFFERGFKALKPGGVLTYISSNKYFRAGYGEKLRRYLNQNSTIQRLIDFGDAPVFTAISYPSIITLQKTKPADHRLRALTWEPGPAIADFPRIFATDSFLMPQQALTAEGWRLEPSHLLALLEKLRNIGIPLGKYVGGRFYYGIKTGCNEAFVVDQTTRDRLIAEHPSSAEILKPFLRGRDVKRWRIENPGFYLCYVGWKLPIKDYPAIHKHLKKYEKVLKARPEVKKGHVPWYALSRYASDYWEEFEQPKVVFSRFTSEPNFGFDESGFYINNALWIISRVSPSLVGLLNSSLVWWYLLQHSTDLQNKYIQIFQENLSQIGIPDLSGLNSLVAQILATKRANLAADTSALEAEIDQRVYQLYGLTDEEIAIVEEAVG